MIEMGVLDPVKVSRVTLQNAASVASLILITEATVSDVPKTLSLRDAIAAATAGQQGGGMYLRPTRSRTPTGDSGAGRGLLSERPRTSKRLRIALRAAEPLCPAEYSGEVPVPPRIPCVNGLEVGLAEKVVVDGSTCPAVSRLCRERRVTLGWVGNVVVAATGPRQKLPLA